MSQHERDMENEREIQKALAEDTQLIQSPAELDKQLLERARAQAEANQRRQRKQRFKFWQYCAAASAAGLVVLSSWLFMHQPEQHAELASEPLYEKQSATPAREMADAAPVTASPQPALQSARAKLPTRSTIDCTRLMIPQALNAQQRYVTETYAGELQQAALQQIAAERALYEQLQVGKVKPQPVTWRVDWWQGLGVELADKPETRLPDNWQQCVVNSK